MKHAYIEKNLSPKSHVVVEQANAIIEEYQGQGFMLTLRQLYYQFVSRDLLANTQQSYKRLGGIVNDGRLLGLIDWDAIEDRTRNLESLSHWNTPASIISGAAWSYRLARWTNQPYYIEVWVEKEALAGVFTGICEEWDVPLFCCRGYTSQSEMHDAALRLRRHARNNQKPVILHFGDHDPSGIDMTRDIVDRMNLFGCDLSVDRLALNMDQVEEHQPPPNPAKVTDSRFEAYMRNYGDESWELDALEPATLAEIVRNQVSGLIDTDAWNDVEEREIVDKQRLQKLNDNWESVADYLDTL